jgi:hypothetical protein
VIVILLSARSQSDGGKVLKTAAQAYKVPPERLSRFCCKLAERRSKWASNPVAYISCVDTLLVSSGPWLIFNILWPTRFHQSSIACKCA